ncbi:hypothetical protein Pfo_002757 [Paulownia fortunei]|nr:hypothetical protein Pfo_002757 [Paulownia fortunei]
MEMREFSAFFLLSLVSFACITDARKDPRDYWKSKMNGEPMPKAIADLYHQNPASDSTNLDRFVRNFETKPNVIIYHSHHVHSEKSKPSTIND